jgi:hypothetical protein
MEASGVDRHILKHRDCGQAHPPASADGVTLRNLYPFFG